MNSLEQSKKNKAKQKIQKIADKLQEKLNKQAVSLRLKYEALRDLKVEEITKQYDKKLEKQLKKTIRKYEDKMIKEKKLILWQKPKAKKEKIWKVKLLAYKLYQYVRKLSLADKDWMVMLADKKTKCHRSECVAGHIYSKSWNGHMAFIDMNVRPITSETNRIQGTSPWIYWALNVLNYKELDYLKWMSENKELKNEIRDTNYYNEMIDKYKIEAIKQEERLGIKHEKRFFKIPLQKGIK